MICGAVDVHNGTTTPQSASVKNRGAVTGEAIGPIPPDQTWFIPQSTLEKTKSEFYVAFDGAKHAKPEPLAYQDGAEKVTVELV